MRLLYYLDFWFGYDARNCGDFGSKIEDVRRKAFKRVASVYKVARGFPKDREERHFEYAVGTIDEIASVDEESVCAVIETLCEKLTHFYNNGRVLSATTKLLWHKIKHPIVMYDSKARKALGTRDGDYAAYLKAWRLEFERRKGEIVDACGNLVSVKLYSRFSSRPDREIEAVASKVWFHERVFDLMLWLDRG